MKFKLLHVRPHVWFFKQQETISKANSDDSSSDTPYVYKRSTSLRLVKSDPSIGSARRDNKPAHAPKPPPNSASQLQNHRRDVRVCTIVDAGCTCRATVSSENKQKKAMAAPRGGNVKVGSDKFHEACRPRRGAQINQQGGASSSVVSRLVCKSSQDVVSAHSAAPIGVEQRDVAAGDSIQHDSKEMGARASVYAEDAVQAGLRNAGFEERRRSSTKKNRLYYEEPGSPLSSGISSNYTTNTNSGTLITRTSAEMQDLRVNANPAFDKDTASDMDDSMLSVEDLRASIAQRKPSLGEQDDGTAANGARVNAGATSRSPGVAKTKVASRTWRPSVHSLAAQASEEMSEKHIDEGVSKKLCFSEYGDPANQGGRNQSRDSARRSTHKEAVGRGQMSKLSRRTTSPRRGAAEASIQKGPAAEGEVKKAIASRAKLAASLKGETLLEALKQRNLQECDRDLDHKITTLERPNSDAAAAADDDHAQGRALSSSCEIQVLSDYSYDPHSDDTLTYPMIRMHVDCQSPSHHTAAQHRHGNARSAPTHATPTSSSHRGEAGAARQSDASSLGQHELMRSDSAVAMVKSSYDPRRDFKESMMEMVVAKRLRHPRQLQQLLRCYLSLNPTHYHPTIIKVFHELCSELFP